MEEGIRFPDAAADIQALQIFNPLDPFAMIKNGILFPAYDRESWMTTGDRIAETQIISFSQQSFQMVQKMMARQRVRYGAEFQVCTNSAFWQSGTYDPLTGIFSRDGEQFQAGLDLNGMPYIYDADGFMHVPVRLRQIWTDTVNEPYWDNITTPVTITGAQIAETWLQGQDMWLDAVGLMFTRLADTGTCHVGIVEVSDYGLPNLKSVIGQTTIQRADMVLNAETVVSLSRPFCRPESVTLSFCHHGCRPLGRNHAELQRRNVLLRSRRCVRPRRRHARPMDEAVPEGRCQPHAQHSHQPGCPAAGWRHPSDRPFGRRDRSPGNHAVIRTAGRLDMVQRQNDVDVFMLGQGGVIPPLLPFRAMFKGTGDIMPCLSLPEGTIKVSRPATALRISRRPARCASSPQTSASSSATIISIRRITQSFQLRTGADFSMVVVPSSTTTVIDPVKNAVEDLRVQPRRCGHAVPYPDAHRHLDQPACVPRRLAEGLCGKHRHLRKIRK